MRLGQFVTIEKANNTINAYKARYGKTEKTTIDLWSTVVFCCVR